MNHMRSYWSWLVVEMDYSQNCLICFPTHGMMLAWHQLWQRFNFTRRHAGHQPPDWCLFQWNESRLNDLSSIGYESSWDPREYWDPATKVSWFSVHDSGQTMLLIVYTVDVENSQLQHCHFSWINCKSLVSNHCFVLLLDCTKCLEIWRSWPSRTRTLIMT